MRKYLGTFLASLLCVSCSPKSKNTSFQRGEMSPLYFYQNMEELENVPLKVHGKIPDWLEGEFVRNGPGIIKGQKASVKSWFDGLGKLHGFTLNEGKATYTCKFLKSAIYEDFKATGELDFVGFAQQSTENSFSVSDFLLDVKNNAVTNANVNVAKINNRLVALTEIPLPVEFDKDLNTLGPFDYADHLPKNFSFESAHILKDPTTNEMWNFLIKISLMDAKYQIYNIPNHSSGRRLVASIPLSCVSYMHSFSLAGKYAVLVDYPLRAKNPKEMAHGFIEAFSWYKNEPTTVYLIDRETGVYKTFDIKPFFSFHHINGYEKDGKVIVDLITYPNADIIHKVNKYPFIKNPEIKVLRLEMDPLKETIKITELTNEIVEFPRINESLISKLYQHFYAVHVKPKGNGIIKFNVTKGKHIHWFKEGAYANEPLFVPHPSAHSEDDGVILSVINDIPEKTSFLLILNAKDLKEIARVEAPHFIPFGFHGQFFQASAGD